MNRLLTCIFTGALLSAAPVLAQTSTVPVSIYPQGWSTGMVGFPATQTVRLNVLNNSTVPAGTVLPSPFCALELSFYDAQGKQLKQTIIGSLLPGTANALELTRSEIPSATASTQRVQVRGQVRTALVPSAGGTASPVNFATACNPFITLEVYDNATGVTQTFTSDARPIAPALVPLLTSGKVPNGGNQ